MLSVYTVSLVLENIELTDSNLDRIFDAFPDALPAAIGGMVTLTVPVGATTPEGAAFSLVDSVASALPDAVPVRLDRDLVSIPDIAERTNRSRESVRLLVEGKRGPGRFPSPVGTVGDAIRVWPWSSVLDWLLESGLVEETGERGISSVAAARVDACLAAKKQPFAEPTSTRPRSS